MSKQVVVVGGGIVGLTAAYFAAKRGDNVTLIEASPLLGGLLKSSETDFGYFDYGVHIASQTGTPALDEFLFSNTEELLYRFEVQESGSFIGHELTQFSPFLNLNSCGQEIANKASAELVYYNETKSYDNLAQIIKATYGETAYQVAYAPFIQQTFGVEPVELPSYYINFFDMYRVVAFDQKTTEQLKQVNYLNDRLGFHQHTKGAPKYYPLKGGIGAWTEYLSQQVVEAGVEIIVGHSVDKISPISAGFDISYAEKTLHVDELIWTVSSALLPRYLPFNTQLQRPNFRKTALFDFIFEQPLNTRCKYINNFEATHISTRLTCYQNLVPVSSFFATTVEVLVDYIDDENQLLEQVATELVAMGLVNKNNPCKFKQYRPVGEGFPVITVENDRLLKQLNQEVLEKYSNITLLGRSSSKGFFMSELLVDAYNSCC